MRLIDADALMDMLGITDMDCDKCKWYSEGRCARGPDFEDACFAIEHVPTIEPEIIRCKDCRWGREACGNIECFVDINVPPEYHGYEWFCPNGERRTDG